MPTWPRWPSSTRRSCIRRTRTSSASPACATSTLSREGGMTAERRSLLPWISLFIVYVVWGSTYLAIRVAVREMPPLAAASIRFLTARLIMAAIALIADRKHGWPSRRQFADYALVGVLLLAFGNGLVVSAERT